MAQVKNLWDILNKHFPPGQYALMQEVSDAAGFNRSRSADYIAVSLWPSRGLGINGIELKSFRSDWLNELKNPKKAENIFKYCDYFWLLTSDETVAKIEEIPVTWGWMCVVNNKISIKKDAPKLTPVTLDRNFMATMLKRAACKDGFVHVDSIQDRIESAKEQGKQETTRQAEYVLKEYKRLTELIKEFEDASGIKINDRWAHNGKQIGEAVNFILNHDVKNLVRRLKQIQNASEAINNTINKALNIDVFKEADQ